MEDGGTPQATHYKHQTNFYPGDVPTTLGWYEAKFSVQQKPDTSPR